jgi:hypothetical protein
MVHSRNIVQNKQHNFKYNVLYVNQVIGKVGGF